MADAKLVEAAKLRIRKTQADALDEDVSQLIEVAIADLKRIGVSESFLSDITDPILREAVITYTNANYGANSEHERLMNCYNMLLIKIKGGKYFE